MENIWAYDFDKSIYDGDSSKDFFFFCLKRKLSLIKYLPLLIFYTFLYGIKKISTKEYKEKFFGFLKSVLNVEELVEEFWKKKEKKIKQFFINDLKQENKSKICIISASPKFLLEGYTKKFKNIDLLATEMDKKTGLIKGENCKGEEKVKRFKNKYKKFNLEKFYSDSKDDEPLAKLANNSYIVLNEKIYKWDNKIFNKKKENKIAFKLFLLFAVFYIILGIYLSYLYNIKQGFIFGADTERVFGDVSEIFYNHYRVKVHPLYVMILQPITLMLSGIVVDKLLAILIFSSIISALSVMLIYKIASYFIKSEKTKLLISVMYGISFSKLVFTASVESFNFAAFFLILLWYFVIKIFKEKSLPKNFYLYLILLGVSSLGITITNVIVYLIALFILWLGKKIKLKHVLLVVLAVGLSSVVLSAIQNYAWHNTPTFHQNLNKNYQEEKKYTTYDINKIKIQNVINYGYIHSIFASDLLPKSVRFKNLNKLTLYIAIIFYLIILIKLIQNFKENKLLNLGIILTMLFNFILHLFYGNSEAFLYSCHFSYLPFLLLIINYNSQHINKENVIFIWILLFIGLIETYFNFNSFKQLLVIVSNSLKHTYFRSLHNPGLFIGILVIIVIIILLCYLFYKLFKKSIKTDNKLIYIIGCISCIVAINLIFIAIQTMPQYDKILDIPLHIIKK